MSIELHPTSTELSELGNGVKKKLICELYEDLNNGKLYDSAFNTEKECTVYKFCTDSFRIDAKKADDETYRGKVTPEEQIYYLQVQKGKKTYANVCYYGNCPMAVIVEGIEDSLDKTQGVWIIPD